MNRAFVGYSRQWSGNAIIWKLQHDQRRRIPPRVPSIGHFHLIAIEQVRESTLLSSAQPNALLCTRTKDVPHEPFGHAWPLLSLRSRHSRVSDTLLKASTFGHKSAIPRARMRAGIHRA